MKRGIVVRAPTGTAQIVAAERGPEKVIYWRLPMPSLFYEPNYKAAQYLAQTRSERTDRQGGLYLQSERYTAYPALLQTEYYRSSYGLRVLQ
jgi:hypothetical protein